MSRKSSFNHDWINPSLHPSWASWLKEVDDKYSAYCTLCKSTFSISNMGRQAVVSHASGTKHKKIIASKQHTASIASFLHDRNASSSSLTPTTTSSNSRPVENEQVGLLSQSVEPNVIDHKNTDTARGLMRYLQADSATRAEILWCIHTVMTHQSARSAAKAVLLFPLMFPDCMLSKKLQLQKDKIAYTITYGLSPYFQADLLKNVSVCDHVVVCFDESLNKVSQHQQMDLSVRFWDNAKNEVCTRYLNSCFMGHTTAEDLVDSFKAALLDIPYTKILQISMDGPNVNWKFLKNLTAEYEDDAPSFVELGSCGLHVVHGAVKTGHNKTSWDLISFLRALYNLFKNVPARRADYITVTQSNLFPKKFCAVRWLENGPVAERAVAILPHVIQYVDAIKESKSKPVCSSFATVATCVQDKLLQAKLEFFQSLTAEIEPFLREFQTDRLPLVPFLHESLHALLRQLMSRFVKKEVLEKCNTAAKLCKVDFSNQSNLLHPNNIEIGYGAKMALRKANKEEKLPELTVMKFRKECQIFLRTFAEKIIERSPLKYKMTKGAACLSPSAVLNFKTIGESHLSAALEVYLQHNWLTGSECDEIKRVYMKFCSSDIVQTAMKSFKRESEHQPLLQLVKLIMILSHGNANIERGFSINKECLVDNLTEESLVAQRIVYDATVAAGGLHCLSISKGIILSVRNACSHWKEALRRKRVTVDDYKKKITQRKRAAIELRKLQDEKKNLLQEMNAKVIKLDSDMCELKKKTT